MKAKYRLSFQVLNNSLLIVLIHTVHRSNEIQVSISILRHINWF